MADLTEINDGKIVIRTVKNTDIKRITDIYNHYITDTTATFEETPVSENEMDRRIKSISAKYPVIVATINNSVVGYAYAHPWKEKSAYSSTLETTIYLSPNIQAQGIGTRLMHELIARCKKIGIHTIIACITAENTGSCAFHQKLGFKPVSHFKEVGLKFNRHLDIIDYQLIIK
ncbi:MAG: GNAT family N-acetyltransferase [Paramuribaculum sp.]|nr:GNAT family N-acetyltransferase [Paramuribaculum sp.]